MSQGGLPLDDFDLELRGALAEFIGSIGHKDVAAELAISPSALSDHLAERDRKRAHTGIIAAALHVANRTGRQDAVLRFANRILNRVGVEAQLKVLTPEKINARFVAECSKLGDVGLGIINRSMGGNP
jgi:hypothetical protein